MSDLVVSRPPAPGVPTTRPVLNRGSGAKNDMSLWGGVVVGTDDFAPAPARPNAPTNRTKYMIGAVALIVAGIGGYLVVSMMSSKPSPSAAHTESAKPAATDDKPDSKTDAKEPVKSAKTGPNATGADSASAKGSAAVASGSAAVATSGSAAGSSTGATATAGAAAAPTVEGEVDAVSGVGAVIKPKKKTVAKAAVKRPAKKVVKKGVVKKPAPKK